MYGSRTHMSDERIKKNVVERYVMEKVGMIPGPVMNVAKKVSTFFSASSDATMDFLPLQLFARPRKGRHPSLNTYKWFTTHDRGVATPTPTLANGNGSI